MFLSLILIWLHVSSLRFLIKSSSGNTIIEDTERLEESIPEDERDFSLKSGPGILSLIIIIILNLIEIGYFIACVYLFNNIAVIIGASILTGYTFYSLLKFLPGIKKFYKKPSEYLKERSSGPENIINFIATAMEIIFCIYIIIRILFDYKILFNGS
ncbi:MAG: hypothetical protein M1308_08335 [Actinobacteria bacterium]|nr:hypothetical protein [Actinomycetota bacterium]MCL5070889.1 hypothetical protein [Actinomycetota bacterium]